jgi:hypothetical protein
MLSSGIWASGIPLSTARNLREVHPGTAILSSSLSRIGYLGSTPCSHDTDPMAAHFELYIEQNPLLEASRRKISIVKGPRA